MISVMCFRNLRVARGALFVLYTMTTWLKLEFLTGSQPVVKIIDFQILYLFERQTDRERRGDRKRAVSFAGSLPE